MSSPPPSPPPRKKPRARPKFNKVPLKKKVLSQEIPDSSSSAVAASEPHADVEENTLSFFHRSKETYVPRPRKPKNSRCEDTESPSTKRERASEDDSGGDEDDNDDDDEESGDDRRARRQRQAARVRQRYEERKRRTEMEEATIGGDGGTSVRRRSNSLTPPPQLPPPPRRRPPLATNPLTINLDDSDDNSTPRATATAIPDRSDDDDPELTAAIAARARARILTLVPDSPVVSILVTSPINNTNPLIIKRRLDQPLKDVRLHWCRTQGFTPAQISEVFLVWKGRIKVFDYVSCKGIGVGVDLDGNLAGVDEGIGAAGGNVHFEAMTEAIFQRSINGEGSDGDKDEVEEEPEESPLRLTLKTKGRGEYKIKVRPTTTIAALLEAYRKSQSIDETRIVRLYFEGDTLEPEDTIGDTELEDLCMVDVHIN